VFHVLGHEPVAHPVRMRVSRGRGSGPSSLPRSGDGGAREAKEKYRVVVDVPDVQATIHRRDEERAGECVVVAGVRSCRGRQERLTAAVNLATSLSSQGKYDEAEKMQREVLAVDQRVLGAEHPDTLSTAGNLAQSLSRQGKYDEAVAMQREVLAVKQRVLGPSIPTR
jgi:hypothetical protein